MKHVIYLFIYFIYYTQNIAACPPIAGHVSVVPHCQVLPFRVHPSKRLSTDEAQRRETALYDDAREPDEATVTAARELSAAADGGGIRTKSSQSTSCASATDLPGTADSVDRGSASVVVPNISSRACRVSRESSQCSSVRGAWPHLGQLGSTVWLLLLLLLLLLRQIFDAN